MNAESIAPPRFPCLLLGVWFAIACVAGATGRVAALHPPVPQIILVAMTLGALVATWTVPSLRTWSTAVSLRALAMLHWTRLFAGGWFLILASRGELSPRFAIPAGFGDIAVAITGILLVLLASPQSTLGRRLYLAWNLFGMADILMVVFLAARVGMSDPASMHALLRLPLSLLPTFLVPLIIVSHLIALRRLMRGNG